MYTNHFYDLSSKLFNHYLYILTFISYCTFIYFFHKRSMSYILCSITELAEPIFNRVLISYPYSLPCLIIHTVQLLDGLENVPSKRSYQNLCQKIPYLKYLFLKCQENLIMRILTDILFILSRDRSRLFCTSWTWNHISIQ